MTKQEYPGCLQLAMKEIVTGEKLLPMASAPILDNVEYKCGIPPKCVVFGSLALASETSNPGAALVGKGLCAAKDAWKSAGIDIDFE